MFHDETHCILKRMQKYTELCMLMKPEAIILIHHFKTKLKSHGWKYWIVQSGTFLAKEDTFGNSFQLLHSQGDIFYGRTLGISPGLRLVDDVLNFMYT